MSVRVRYAPSPTGFTHLGGLRTALYNYLFARAHAGSLVLRVEDTDRQRFVPGAIEHLVDTMKWAGITFDEGPHIGGKFGPYKQSERTPYYFDVADRLVAKGFAYRCFCSAERISQLRSDLLANNQQIMYDRHCLKTISLARSEELVRQNQSYVVRLLMPEGTTTINDLVHGSVTFDNSLIDDQILVKSDRFPTYHLASVVDDHMMQISHVIRGEEWLSSVPKHLALYNYLDTTPPKFAHLPLLTNPDHTKLSKRQSHASVDYYRFNSWETAEKESHGSAEVLGSHYGQHGPAVVPEGSPRVLPAALLNFVSLLGWSPSGVPVQTSGDDSHNQQHFQEVFTVDELIREFSFSNVNKSPSAVHFNKLKWLNGVHFRFAVANNASDVVATYLWKHMKPEWQSRGEKFAVDVLKCVAERCELVGDFWVHGWVFFERWWETANKSSETFADEKEALAVAEIGTRISQSIAKNNTQQQQQQPPLTWATIDKIIKAVKKESGSKDVMKGIRFALTGSRSGVGLNSLFSVVGVEECLFRITHTTTVLKPL